MLLKFLDVYISLENLKYALIFAFQTVNHVKHRILFRLEAADWLKNAAEITMLYWLLGLQKKRDFCAQFLQLYLVQWRAFNLFLEGFKLAFSVALASCHIIIVVFHPLIASKRVFGGAEQIFARLGKLSPPILGL